MPKFEICAWQHLLLPLPFLFSPPLACRPASATAAAFAGGGFPYPLTRPGLIPNLFGFGAAYLRYIFIFPVSMATCQYSTGCTKVQIPAETCLEAINGS